jgi:hypothetical protein
MAVTNRVLITQALQMLGVIRPNQAASAEDAALGLSEMNDLMADMSSTYGVDIGYFAQDNISADSPLDDEGVAAVKPMLAIRLAIYFPSAEIPPWLPARAGMAQDRLVRDAVLENMQEAQLDNLPRGTGCPGTYNILTGE